ncbi:MAG: DUF2478 domain-containing protein [Rhizobiales bacterium]|nr:DUF2478 domain-containing protein [Hyphomicrobiales bacterium]
MQIIDHDHPITAIVYGDGPEFETFLKATTEAMAGQGMRLAGLIQVSRPQDERRKCDIYLTDLATGEVHGVSDDRGPEARGCRLDVDRLLRAGQAAERAISADTDLLVLCKFGKTEAAGGGFRSLVATALAQSVPVLIGVPRANLEAFRAFAGDTAREWDLADLQAPAAA